jgi:ATP-dependent Clp protease adaptor protein ClpS
MGTKEEVKVDQDIELMLEEIAKKQDMYNLIMFNDDHHDMVQVARQVIKAVKCSRDKALQIMMEAHQSGQAIAMTGPKDEVKKAGNILMEIDLAIDIIKA